MKSCLVALIVVLPSAIAFAELPKDVPAAIPLWDKGAPGSVPAELHLFANAGHGFGYRHNVKSSAAARWPERFTEWLADSGLLKQPETKQP